MAYKSKRGSVFHLNQRQVKESLLINPTISSLDELLAIKGYTEEQIFPEDLEKAKVLIERNRLRLQVMIKQELYNKTDPKAKEQLYKMICNLEELKRFGVKMAETNVNLSPEIVIKSADPDIEDKLKNI